MIANDMADKGLNSKIYKPLLQLDIKKKKTKQTQTDLKMGRSK